MEWCEGGREFPLWRKLGICHGICGVNEQIPNELNHVKQVHGVEICATSAGTLFCAAEEKRSIGDGIYALASQGPIAVKTADCLPVLFFNNKMVMVVHCGWKSLALGILEKASEYFMQQKVAPETIYVGCGPAISPANFEVGPEVIEKFSKKAEEIMLGSAFNICLTKGMADRWFFDLAGFAVLQLLTLGFKAENMSVMRSCTFAHKEKWHSYRRDGIHAGRNWSFVQLPGTGG